MKTVKFSLMVLLVAAVMPIVSCGPSKAEQEAERQEQYKNSEEGKAWDCICSRMKDPSDATLIKYYSTDDDVSKSMLEVINGYGGHSGKYTGLSVAAAEVEGRNGYGQMVKGHWVVCFKYGEPVFAIQLTEDADAEVQFELKSHFKYE